MVSDDCNNTIILECNNLVITGVLSSESCWCEFEITVDGDKPTAIGGYSWPSFMDDILTILKKDKGWQLADIPNARFIDIVGGAKTEYLGNISLTGYNTFFFFRDNCLCVHLVLADCNGDLILHKNCGTDLA